MSEKLYTRQDLEDAMNYSIGWAKGRDISGKDTELKSRQDAITHFIDHILPVLSDTKVEDK